MPDRLFYFFWCMGLIAKAFWLKVALFSVIVSLSTQYSQTRLLKLGWDGECTIGNFNSRRQDARAMAVFQRGTCLEVAKCIIDCTQTGHFRDGVLAYHLVSFFCCFWCCSIIFLLIIFHAVLIFHGMLGSECLLLILRSLINIIFINCDSCVKG